MSEWTLCNGNARSTIWPQAIDIDGILRSVLRDKQHRWTISYHTPGARMIGLPLAATMPVAARLTG
jgi:hypothetical protein